MKADSDRPAPKTALVILNPTAGSAKGERLAKALAVLAEGDCRVEIRPTGARGDAETFARQAAGLGEFRAVIAAGGDGTINEVVNGLAGSSMPLGLLPMGTANVLASELGIADPQAAAKAIVNGKTRTIHLGRCGGRYFTMMAGVGFDARVVAGIRTAEKRRLGKLAYVLQSGRELFARPSPRLEVMLDGTAEIASSVIIANGHYYAGRYVVAPEASLNRPELIACRFTRGDKFGILRAAAFLGMGIMPHLPDLSRKPVSRIELNEPAGEPVQADGDIVAHIPCVIEAGVATVTVLA
ncbi:diacylglycerol/lipid kinase family protein [Lacibacterium aquatile]